jgi:hypothetical protein
MKLYQSRVGPQSNMIDILIKRGNFDRDTHSQGEHHEDERQRWE